MESLQTDRAVEPAVDDEGRASPPFEVEDRTDPEFVRELAEARTLVAWVIHERQQGHLPN